ncbi:FtsX-like permease family protein [Enterococcus villorum]|uniref:ABC transporter permease n=2 Tax=Enterococcus villorum TaxID=112904 RepID=A0A511J4C7_9ENTE|nr:FtsX-like permease family protein [Enterococcus villorum]EOH92084.1 efflux ABC transporter permease [Enterococcus villorum ATCC 700913]EOW76580.1 efflux ABC transporter permease [Enterococcus villorum ATCC 700913]GEL92834.1 ABC transporter permease [Enterococcus villorum]
MKTKTYLKASFREIRQSKGRFIAIVLIIMLGTLLFVGVKTAGPVMQKTMDQYVNKGNLSDLQIISTAGLTDEDIVRAKKTSGVQVETSKQFYYSNTNKNEVVQIFSYDASAKQNSLEVVAGRLPKNKNELVLDEKAKKLGYKIGTTYTIDSDDLKQTSYKITGFVRSPLFINNLERGYANVGNGTIDYFIYLPEEDFQTKIQSVIYLTFKNVASYDTYSKEYQDKMAQNQETVEKIFQGRAEERLKELKKQAMDSLQPAKQKIQTGQAQIDTAKNQLKTAKSQLAQQTASIEQLPEIQRERVMSELSAQQIQLTEQEKQVAEEQEKLNKAQTEIKENEEKIDHLEKPTYRYQERSDNVGFQEFGDLAERIAAIANVFPVFFFFIAALITFTTMTRMVEENRREIGTLKALGYTKFEIAKKYAIYASLASGLGIILGTILGTNLLPRIIFELSNERYDIGSAVIFYDWLPIFQAALAFFIAAFGAAMFVLFKDLRERPAALLQPKAPKPGKRILLEYITPFWSRLSFNQKISYRNLFRYKSRMFMAIIGIAGCAGLMVAGVGLKDSLSSVSEKQFGPITNYQAIVTIDKEADQSETKVKQILEEDSKVTNLLAVDMQTIELRQKGQASQSVTMIVPKETAQLSPFIYLMSQDKKKIDLPDSGIVITEKAAELFDLANGDKISLYTDEEKEWNVTVKAVAQNYLGNFIYLSSSYYKEVSGKKATTNAYLVQSDAMTKKQEDALSEKLLATNAVMNTSFVSKQMETQEESLANLDSVVLIFVVLSGLLAFIVLYNLTNINISERVRELSTIKVLGFFDKEVTMYIVRENMIFTLLGIVSGFGIGYVLTDFILQQASMETVIFPLVITWKAYALSAILTIVFTIIVMVVTHFKLKHIHMIDALKSNE